MSRAAPDRNAREGERVRACLLAALALVAAAHAAALAGDFVWDDRLLVLENPAVVGLRSPLAHLQRTFWSGASQDVAAAYYRPVATLSLALDYTVWDGRALGFRLTNLLTHLACTALVFGLARRAGAGALGAGLAALLFGAFPRGTEAVDWISGRTDLLAAAGALGALLLHDGAGASAARRWLAAAALLAGMLAKETAIAGVAALVALEVAAARARAERPRLARIAPALLALAIALSLRGAAGALPAVAASDSAGGRALTALGAIGAYALRLLDPLRPSIVGELVGGAHPLHAIAGVAALGACVAVAWLALRRGSPLVLAALALALAALLPALHLLPLPVRYLAADRCLYLPVAAGAVALAGALAPWLAERPRFAARAAWACTAAAAVFLPATALRAARWCDEVALWQGEIARADPRDALPHALLGESLLREGRAPEALARLEHALALDRAWSAGDPAIALAEGILANLAGCRLALGHPADALAALDELVARRPDQAKHRYNRGVVYARLGRLDEAAREFDVALSLAPGWPQAERARRDLARLPKE